MITRATTQFYDYVSGPSAGLALTGPAVEPVTVAEAKRWMKVFIDQDDELIAELITDARIEVEAASQRALITQQVEMAITRFPDAGLSLELLRAPVQSVQFVQYCTPVRVDDWIIMVNPADVGDPMLAEFVFVPGSPGRIDRLWGWWPVVSIWRSDPVHVRYTIGYGDTADRVPAPAKLAIKMIVHSKYDHRQAITGENLRPLPSPLDIENMIRKLSYGFYI